MQSNQMAQIAIEQNTFALGKQGAQSKDQLQIERVWKMHWLTDYADDIFVNMKEAEMRRRPIYFNSMQLDERPRLVQLCNLAARTCKLNRATVHLGIYYMDRLTDYFTIRSDKLQLLALTCLHIAAQIENTDANVPRYKELNCLIREGYTPFEYKVVERKVLTHLNFELMRPTTASFTELFACSFLTRADYVSYNALLENGAAAGEGIQYLLPYDSFESMLAALSHLLLSLSDCTLSINSFANVRPSLLAAACIAAVRRLSGLQLWSQYLTKLTSYTQEEVEPLVANIREYYHWYQGLNTSTSYVNMGPSSADSINPNWSTPDSGIEESVVVMEELVTVEYNIITVELQETASGFNIDQEELPQPQQQAAPACVELQEKAKSQASKAMVMADLRRAFKRKSKEIYSQEEPQEQANSSAVDMAELQRALKRRLIAKNCQEQLQPKRQQ
ncbi:cyclin-J [Drosophila guanche]|uniref:Blast:G2/mitotic-specific cyclin-A n=1 Tax=Drosophila guanche TaxID=7266 RepID=A0A3B0K3I1_DROGU|nr:cyclin-J [Drosophila guanche]SPP87232.1 blast:G2/mitotic-specific cyclin-A [Drosophila guanche]